jgi:hypothetical protein
MAAVVRAAMTITMAKARAMTLPQMIARSDTWRRLRDTKNVSQKSGLG